MASLAPTVQSAISPKKRSYVDYSADSDPLPSPQRMHGPSPNSKRLQKAQNEEREPKLFNPMGSPTGLEGLLDLDQQFVEATKATGDDEALRAVKDPISDPDFAERRRLTNELSWSFPEDILRAGRGLPNITGTLCYRHSLFQALLHIPKFVNWLLKHHMPQDCVTENVNDCVSCHMRQLVALYWSPRFNNMDEIGRLLSKIHVLFKRLQWHPHSENGHGDPDDQLAWILEKMRGELPLRVFRYFDAFHNSVLESEIICDKCGGVSKTAGNNERHFPIPISCRSSRQRTSQLSTLIDSYMDEIVDGYRCEKDGCNSMTEKHRVQKIAYAPDILLVQLKRFNWRGLKDSARIIFTEKLDLTRHVSDQSQGPLSYELIAVVCHQGSTGFGHYICVARTDFKTPHREWKEYDDRILYNATASTAINPAKEISKDWTPYLLFYKRSDDAELAK